MQRNTFKAQSTIRLCSLMLFALALLGVFGPMLLPSNYANPGPDQFAAPSWNHWLGTDLNGRDLLYRMMLGIRVSLLVGLCGAFVSLTIGVSYGLAAGYCGGRIDNILMRIVDTLYSIPRLIFVLILINALNDTILNFATEHALNWLVQNSRIVILILALGFIEWLTMARIVRGEVLAIKSRQYVHAAKALGQSHMRIITRHLIPNIAGIIIIYLTLTIPAVIIDESFLSFLGLGVQAPLSSLGSLLASGATAINPIKSYWWTLVFPAAVMILLLLALNFIGDALRDLCDVRLND